MRSDQHPSLFHTLAILALGFAVSSGYVLIAWMWWR